MAREIELKFEVEPGAAVKLGRVLAGAPGGEAREYRSIYFDLPKGALAKAGFSLRVRQAGGRHIQTVKHQEIGNAGLFDRAEWEWEVSGPTPNLEKAQETPLKSLLLPRDGKRLKPVIETIFFRTEWTVERSGARIIASFDEGSVRSGGRESAIREIELELAEGGTDALFAIAEDIARKLAIRPGVLTKAERGRRLAKGKLCKPVKAKPIALAASMDLGEGFRAIAHACLRHYRLNEMVLLGEPDPSALHQARVALRRLRSSFSLFGKAIRDSEFEQLKDELRWFTGTLGDARDLDVFIKRLPKSRREARPGERELRATLMERREQAYFRAMSAINSERHRRLMLRLLRWIEIGEWRERATSGRPLPRFGRKRLDRRWKKVAKAGERLRSLPTEELHGLRIDVKKLRYAAEFLSSLHGSEALADRRRRFAEATAQLQEQLGLLNDAATARSLVDALPLATADERAFAHKLVGKEPDRENCIAAAERSFKDLRKAADYWRP